MENNKYSEKKREMTRNEFDLPLDLLPLIISRLPLKFNIRASAVCKTWHKAALSVRVVGSPWLMYRTTRNSVSYKFYSPLDDDKETITVELPEISNSRVCYSKDGWLLMNNPHLNDHDIYFFNPFTRDRINLPRFGKSHQKFAFSCAPTMSSCVVFSICFHLLLNHVSINTWSPGATEWVTENFVNQLALFNGQWRNMVFSDGLFYCLSNRDKVGVFDPSARCWSVYSVRPPRPHHFLEGAWYVAEHKGAIFLIDASSKKPVVFKLNRFKSSWEEKKTLKGSTIFASHASCEFKPELTGTMRNKVYFWKMPFNSTSCMSYSFDERRYFPDRTEGDALANPKTCEYNSIWIEPLQKTFNISAFTIMDSEFDISSIFEETN